MEIKKAFDGPCIECSHAMIRKDENGNDSYIACEIGGIHDLSNKSCNIMLLSENKHDT